MVTRRARLKKSPRKSRLALGARQNSIKDLIVEMHRSGEKFSTRRLENAGASPEEIQSAIRMLVARLVVPSYYFPSYLLPEPKRMLKPKLRKRGYSRELIRQWARRPWSGGIFKRRRKAIPGSGNLPGKTA